MLYFYIANLVVAKICRNLYCLFLSSLSLILLYFLFLQAGLYFLPALLLKTNKNLACHSVVCLTVDQITHLKGHLSYSLKIDIENAAEENACYLRKALRQRTINQQKP